MSILGARNVHGCCINITVSGSVRGATVSEDRRYSPFQYLNFILNKVLGIFIKWKSKVLSKDTEDTALHVHVSVS